jgi:two-component sensor histidine kinase
MSETAAHVAELERRLAEAEETLRAIRDGEVDALLVRGNQRDEVFHIGGGEESYRAFMEAMDAGAAALDEDKRLIYANASLASLLRRPTVGLQGEDLFEALGQPAGDIVRQLLEGSRRGRQSIQVALPQRERTRQVVIAAAPLPLGFSTGWALTFTDITERVEAAAAEESERLGRAIMASANEAVVVCDTAGTITHASSAVLDILSASPVGERFETAFQLSFAPGAGAMLAEDLVTLALAGTSLRGIEASVQSESRVKDVMISAAPLRHARGVVGGCIITLVDLTQRKALEKRQTLLMRELDHRMKNMLALVQSISARTLAGARDLADFGDRFSQRMAALAATQDLLAERAWTSLPIASVLEAELAPYVSPRSSRIVLRNLAMEIGRDAAVAIGLVFHELVTNAVKYGSLAVETGRLSVIAERLPDGDLEIVWEETGGPLVTPPAKAGFGQTIISRGLGHSASGPTMVEFKPDGVVCRIRLSREALV